MPVNFLSPWADELEKALRASGMTAEGNIGSSFSVTKILALTNAILAKFPPKPSIAIAMSSN